jgi:SPP1 family phage portal protein
MLQNVPAEGSAEYIAKTFNETQIEVLRGAIENDIHKISMTPNMSDENFVGNSSGVAIAYKLLPFEQNITNKERSMESGLKQRFQLYVNYLSFLSKMQYVPSYDIDIVFKRNLPKNDYETSQMINNLRGYVSPETLISQLTFVKDPSEEIERARESEMMGYNGELPEFGTPEATLETLEEKGLVEATAKQDSLLSKLKNLLSGE